MTATVGVFRVMLLVKTFALVALGGCVFGAGAGTVGLASEEAAGSCRAPAAGFSF